MGNTSVGGRVLWAVVIVVACALPAAAQSAISGVVRDSSGAAMPGVTVEASSPVLIEKVKTTVTDGNGGYRITELRPGAYTVTFMLPGFSTFRRDGFEVPDNFTGTLNATLTVGALEETVTVTGASPVVDVSSAARVQTLDRETLDTLPTGRSIFSMGQLVPGVNLNQPDTGGSRAMQQTYMSTRGLTSANNIVQVDGMMINGLDGDGAVQQYINNSFIQEMTYQTAGAGADISPGGVRVNIVAKDGGNRFSGSFFGAWNDGSWQADNFSDELRASGLRSVDKIRKIWDFNFGMGGPILKDRLWFFGSARHWGVHSPLPEPLWCPRDRRSTTASADWWHASRALTISKSRARSCASRGRPVRATRSPCTSTRSTSIAAMAWARASTSTPHRRYGPPRSTTTRC
jgi:hypothetical protein